MDIWIQRTVGDQTFVNRAGVNEATLAFMKELADVNDGITILSDKEARAWLDGLPEESKEAGLDLNPVVSPSDIPGIKLPKRSKVKADDTALAAPPTDLVVDGGKLRPATADEISELKKERKTNNGNGKG